MATLPIMTAAQLVQASYDPANQPDFARRIKHALNKNDVEAYLLESGTLVIPGSNSLADYVKFNTRVFRVGGKRYKVKNLATERL
jgi:TATA-box binding protein (TBP) (component of TFIID and TFIIIB)